MQFLLLSKDNLSAVRGAYLVYRGVVFAKHLFFMCHVKGLCIEVRWFVVFELAMVEFVHSGCVGRCFYSHSFNFI